ncbi:MAG: HEPN domain-containing protein [Marinilabiliaceae bacterium]|nr:HEPN domain-containing protein [Marinilabiliaceae bacterium]
MKTQNEKIRHWIKISDEDLNVAETLLNNKHYLYAGFICHLAIEKIFKACYQKLKNQTPPFIHDLSRLAKLADFYHLLSNDQKLFVNTLTPLNIEARYPEYKEQVAKTLKKDICREIFEKTKILQKWTKETIL